MPSAINFSISGTLKDTKNFLKNAQELRRNAKVRAVLSRFGEDGVRALEQATPKRTGVTSKSWYYTIEDDGNNLSVIWHNSNVNNYVNIAIILQTGHATKNGGYVQGVDYINPALRPVFDKMSDDMWKAVMSL